MKLPSFQFYPGDWMKDPAIRAVSIEARGLWIDMLCLLFESDRRGYLQHATGKPVALEQLARMTGCSTEQASRLLQELEDSGVFSRTEHGIIYSRRMVRDDSIRKVRAEAGAKGGNPVLLNQNSSKTQANHQAKRKQKPTPSSSSSSSPAKQEEETSPSGEAKKKPPIQKPPSVRPISEDDWGQIRDDITFAGIDLDIETRKIDAWLAEHPDRVKSKRFVVNWLAKCVEYQQKNGGNGGGGNGNGRAVQPDHGPAATPGAGGKPRFRSIEEERRYWHRHGEHKGTYYLSNGEAYYCWKPESEQQQQPGSETVQ